MKKLFIIIPLLFFVGCEQYPIIEAKLEQQDQSNYFIIKAGPHGFVRRDNKLFRPVRCWLLGMTRVLKTEEGLYWHDNVGMKKALIFISKPYEFVEIKFDWNESWLKNAPDNTWSFQHYSGAAGKLVFWRFLNNVPMQGNENFIVDCDTVFYKLPSKNKKTGKWYSNF